MSSPRLITPIRRAGLLVVASLVAAGFAAAQSASSAAASPSPTIDQFTHSPFSGTGSSSSQDGLGQAGLSASGLQMAEFSLPGNPASGASFGGGAGGGQYGQGGGSGGGHRGVFHHPLAFEAGGGFNGPVGNDTPYITWGGNFTVGARLPFLQGVLHAAGVSIHGRQAARRLYFGGQTLRRAMPISTRLPALPSSISLRNGITASTWLAASAFTTSRQTSAIMCAATFMDTVSRRTSSRFTSNQWGGSGGLGFYHRLGGDMYGPDTAGTSEIFAEARYLYVHTPPISQNNGLGTTELIPVTVGVRF